MRIRFAHHRASISSVTLGASRRALWIDSGCSPARGCRVWIAKAPSPSTASRQLSPDWGRAALFHTHLGDITRGAMPRSSPAPKDHFLLKAIATGSCPPAALGVSFDLSTIGFSSGGGSYGLNLEYVPGDGLGFYTFGTKDNSTSAGFDVGASLTANVAFGSGPWSGDFLTAMGAYMLPTGGGFETPSSEFPGIDQPGIGWYGIQAGAAIGSPGVGRTITNYTKQADLSLLMPWCR